MATVSQGASVGPERLPAPLERVLSLARAGVDRVREAARVPAPRPLVVLGALVVCEWLVALEVGRIAAHQGWLYYDGGDSTWYYTSAWVLAHGHIPFASIGYGYSLLIAPLVRIAGANELAGLPLIVLLNTLVLAPIGMLCVVGISKAIGGLRFAYAAAVVWILLPVIAIRYFLPPYHSRYVDIALPDSVGLTAVGDFPSMICLLVAAYFCFRALSSRARLDALTAGLAAGLACGVKPANALFLPAALLALAVARRPRALALFVAGLVPSLIALALWKYRGLGNLPLFSSQQLALALGTRDVPPLASLPIHVGRYLHFNWSLFRANYDGFREFGWSKRLVEWLALAGFVGLARRTLAGAVLIGGWLLSYFLLKGGNPNVSFDGGSFFTHILPAVPAFALLTACVVFLLPVWGRRPLPEASAQGWPARPRSRRRVAALAAFLAIVPIGVIALLPPLTQPAAADQTQFDLYFPASQFPLSARALPGGRVVLTWPRQATHGAHVAFFIFRGPSDELTCTPVAHAASDCAFSEPYISIVGGDVTRYVDLPPPGTYSYRVALSATGMGGAQATSPILLSDAASVTLRP